VIVGDDGNVIRPMFARAGDAIRPILDDGGDEPVESLAVRYVAPMMEQVGQKAPMLQRYDRWLALRQDA
jgi:hypothetical protein